VKRLNGAPPTRVLDVPHAANVPRHGVSRKKSFSRRAARQNRGGRAVSEKFAEFSIA
jgi:hypothetical protein